MESFRIEGREKISERGTVLLVSLRSVTALSLVALVKKKGPRRGSPPDP